MLSLSARLSYANVMSTLAVFALLAGGTAYAANTIGSSDIIDGQVKEGRGSSRRKGPVPHHIRRFDLPRRRCRRRHAHGRRHPGQLARRRRHRLAAGRQRRGPNDSLLQSDIRAGAVTGDEVLDNSLTGADINESALNLPSRARFVSVSGFDSRVAETTVPEGNYLVYLAANYRTEANDGQGKRVLCELFSQPAGQAAGFIGDARSIDRTTLDNPLDPRTTTSRA